MTEMSTAEITRLIRAGAKDAARGYPPQDQLVDESQGAFGPNSENMRRVKKARVALQRAEAKNAVKAIKPLRSLRRDQAAVNEALVDAVRSLLALNRELLRELEQLQFRLIDVETQLPRRQRIRRAESE